MRFPFALTLTLTLTLVETNGRCEGADMTERAVEYVSVVVYGDVAPTFGGDSHTVYFSLLCEREGGKKMGK